MEGVGVLIGVELEAGADLLRAPGENFQGPDGSPCPRLSIGKAPDVTIAHFLSCRDGGTLLGAELPNWALGRQAFPPLPGDSLKTMGKPHLPALCLRDDLGPAPPNPSETASVLLLRTTIKT